MAVRGNKCGRHLRRLVPLKATERAFVTLSDHVFLTPKKFFFKNGTLPLAEEERDVMSGDAAVP